MKRYALLLVLAGCGVEKSTGHDGAGVDPANQVIAAASSNPECQACANSDATCEALSSNAGCWLKDSTGLNAFCAVDCTQPGVTCPTNTVCTPDTTDAFSLCTPTTASGTCADWNNGSSGGSSGGASGLSTGGTSGTSTGASTGGSSGTSTGASTGGASGASTGGSTGGSSGASTGGSTGRCTPYTYSDDNAYVSNFFTNTCSSCHKFTTYAAVQAQASQIETKLSTNAMPPATSGKTVSAADRANIVQWLQCGEPQ